MAFIRKFVIDSIFAVCVYTGSYFSKWGRTECKQIVCPAAWLNSNLLGTTFVGDNPLLPFKLVFNQTIRIVWRPLPLLSLAIISGASWPYSKRLSSTTKRKNNPIWPIDRSFENSRYILSHSLISLAISYFTKHGASEEPYRSHLRPIRTKTDIFGQGWQR